MDMMSAQSDLDTGLIAAPLASQGTSLYLFRKQMIYASLDYMPTNAPRNRALPFVV
jgi:hypothetical protein